MYLVSTASSSARLLLYADSSRCLLAVVIGRAFTVASVKLGTKQCLQNDA